MRRLFTESPDTSDPVALLENPFQIFLMGAYLTGQSGYPMHFIRKGTRKRGWNKWNYLVNSANIAGNPKNSWNYNIFEEYVLYHLESLDWQALIPDSRTDENVGQRISLEARIADIKATARTAEKTRAGN